MPKIARLALACWALAAIAGCDGINITINAHVKPSLTKPDEPQPSPDPAPRPRPRRKSP